MTVYGPHGAESNDTKLLAFHNSRDNPIEVKCIKDNPAMHGFGRSLHINDIVTIKGTVENHLGFCVCVPSETAFYEYTAFEPYDPTIINVSVTLIE